MYLSAPPILDNTQKARACIRGLGDDFQTFSSSGTAAPPNSVSATHAWWRTAKFGLCNAETAPLAVLKSCLGMLYFEPFGAIR